MVTSIYHAIGCLGAAKKIHNDMLFGALRWPMTVFDTTPIGRILNRFSQDINVLDNILPMLLQSQRMMLFSVTDFLKLGLA